MFDEGTSVWKELDIRNYLLSWYCFSLQHLIKRKPWNNTWIKTGYFNKDVEEYVWSYKYLMMYPPIFLLNIISWGQVKQREHKQREWFLRSDERGQFIQDIGY